MGAGRVLPADGAPLGLGKIWWSLVTFTGLYFILASPFTANFFLRQFEQYAAAQAMRCPGRPPRGSVFIVLGGGVSKGARSPDDIGWLHLSTMRRVIAGAREAGTVPGSVLVLSGGGNSNGIAEASLMAAMAEETGVPRSAIEIDRKSTNTLESARNLKRLLGASEQKPVYLITSAIHMYRALEDFRFWGLPVCADPVDFRQVDASWEELFLPRLTALEKTAAALHEAVGAGVTFAAPRRLIDEMSGVQ